MGRGPSPHGTLVCGRKHTLAQAPASRKPATETGQGVRHGRARSTIEVGRVGGDTFCAAPPTATPYLHLKEKKQGGGGPSFPIWEGWDLDFCTWESVEEMEQGYPALVQEWKEDGSPAWSAEDGE